MDVEGDEVQKQVNGFLSCPGELPLSCVTFEKGPIPIVRTMGYKGVTQYCKSDREDHILGPGFNFCWIRCLSPEIISPSS